MRFVFYSMVSSFGISSNEPRASGHNRCSNGGGIFLLECIYNPKRTGWSLLLKLLTELRSETLNEVYLLHTHINDAYVVTSLTINKHLQPTMAILPPRVHQASDIFTKRKRVCRLWLLCRDFNCHSFAKRCRTTPLHLLRTTDSRLSQRNTFCWKQSKQ